eukprot:1152646-Pelagomonas_calceolata.AAC.1
MIAIEPVARLQAYATGMQCVMVERWKFAVVEAVDEQSQFRPRSFVFSFLPATPHTPQHPPSFCWQSKTLTAKPTLQVLRWCRNVQANGCKQF